MVARRRRLGDDAFLLTIVASIALVHAVFIPTTRLTSPMAVVLMFYTGVAWDRSLCSLTGSSAAAPTRR